MKYISLPQFSSEWIAVVVIGVGIMAGPGQAIAQQPLGIDVSSYQGSINWTDVKSAGYSFAWAKATEGTFYIDAYFTANEANAKSAGVDIGGYHFAHPEEDIGDAGADAEASYFWNEAKSYLTGGDGRLVPMLDFEESYSTGTYMSDWINEWCGDIKNYAAANGAVCNPVVYTDGSIASSLSSPATDWPLDIADPGYTDPQGESPSVSLGPWSDWTFWQYSWTGSVSGVSGEVDEDIIDGTASTLAKFVISTTGTVAGPGVTLKWNDGNGGTGTWNTGTANWLLSGTGDVIWSTGGDYADFAGTAGTVTLGADVEADGLAFDTAGYVIAGSDTLTLNSPGNINVVAGTPTYIECVLTGVGYNLSGGGVLVLNNADNDSGSGTSAEYIIGPGTTLVVANNADVGGGGVTLNLQAGGIYQDNDTTSGDPFLLSGSAIALLTGGGVFDNPNASLTMAEYITGPGSLTTIGTTYTLTLSDTGNTYTGGTIVQSGTLKANAAGVLGSTSGPLTVSGGTLDLNAASHTAGAMTISSGTLQNGTLTGSSYTGEGGTVSAVLAGSGAWTQTSGTTTLSGANTFTGKTTINDGLLQISADNNLGAAPGSAVADQLTLNNTSTGNYGLRAQNATFSLSAHRGITLGANGGSIQVASSFTLTVPGIITGSSGLQCGTAPTVGEGTLILSGANTYTGATAIAAGTLQLGASGALPSGTGLTVASAAVGGIFNLNNFNQTIGSLASSAGINGTGTTTSTVSLGSGALTVNGTSSSTFAGVISGSGSLTLTGAGGVLALTGANTYTGGTTVEGGATLSINADSGLGATSSILTLNDGCLKNNDSAPTASSSRTISLGASGGYMDAGWAPSEPVTIAGPITGSGMLNINLDGSPVILTSTGNTYSGGTTIGVLGPGSYAPGTQAWLKLGANNALPSGSGDGNVTINGTYLGLLDLAGFSQTINGLSGTGTVNNSTGNGSLSVGGNNQTSAFSGVIENTGGTLTLTKAGSGTLTLSGVNTYTGGTTVSAGTLVIGGAGQLGGGAYAGAIANSGTFNYNSSAGQTLSGSISGTGALEQSGSGTLALSVANSYNGGTTISGGALYGSASGSIPGNVSVSAGALELGNANTMSSSATLTLPASPSAGQVNLNFSGTQNISALNFGSTSMAQGTWGASGATHNNAAFTGTGLLNVTSGGASQTITFPNPGTQTYGIAPIALSATAPGGTVTYSVPSGPATVVGSTLTITGAGSVTVQANQSGSTTYNAAPAVNQTFTVNRKPLSYTGISATNTVYNGTTTASLSGTAATLTAEAPGTGSTSDGAPYTGDTVSFTTGTLTGSYASKNVANGIAVTVTGGVTLSGSSAGNYSVGSPNTALAANITSATLGVTASAQSKTYGQTLSFGSGSTLFTSSGLQNSETIGSVTLAVSGNGGAATAPVGTYTITPSAATGGSFTAANYNITYYTNTLTVTLPPNTIPVTITSVNLLNNGTVQMNFSGTPGYVYVIEATSNLYPPIAWTTLSTNAADSNGLFSFTDLTAPGYDARYYQTVAQ